MIFYVSIRPVNFDGKRLLSPKYMLNEGFKGIPIKWKSIANAISNDGRWLYEIETDTIEHRDVILEGLQMWGVHLKTLESAKIFVKKLLNIDVTISPDKLIFPINRGI